MKCQELAKIIDQLGSFVRSTGGNVSGAEALTSILELAPAHTILQLSKTISGIGSLPPNTTSKEILDAHTFAEASRKALNGIVKATIVTDFTALGVGLKPFVACDFKDFLSSVRQSLNSKKVPATPVAAREDVVRKYQITLEQALGDDSGFALVMTRLQDDNDVRTPEILAIAKRFAFASTKTRAAALKKIQARHQSLMTSRAKAAATAGRIAG